MSEAPELLQAALRGDLEAVRNRVEKCGDSVDLKGEYGDTALHWAAWEGRTEVIRYLLGRGADPKLAGWSGETPEKRALRNGKTEAAAILAAACQKPCEDWVPMGAANVAHVGVYPALHRKLTQIFDFAARDRVIVTQNLETGGEAVGPATRFDDLPARLLRTALSEFRRFGGVADENFVMGGGTVIDKRPGLKVSP